MTSKEIEGLILVTGGSGFIGTHFVNLCIARGLRVANLDRRAPILEEHTPYWHEMDLNNRDAVIELIRTLRPTIIYNLAAHASLDGGAGDFSVNVSGPNNLVAAAATLDFRPLIVHISTQLVTRPGFQTVVPGELAPYTLYGESKADSERVFYKLPQDWRWVILRPTNIWGPHHPTFGKVILKYIGKGWYLHPGGEETSRSYGYVENVAHQLLRVAEIDASLVEGKVFYVGDEPMPVAAWSDAFGIAMRGKPVKRLPRAFLTVVALLGEISRRLGGPSPLNFARLERLTTDYAVPMAPTFETLGRGPITFDEGVRKTVRWLREL